MKNNQELHILITGERGIGRSLVITKQAIKTTLISSLSVAVVLFISAVVGVNLFFANQSLKKELTTITGHSKNSSESLMAQLSQLQSQLKKVTKEKELILTEYQKEVQCLKEQKEELLAKSVHRLDERARIIEAIVSTIGVEIKIEEDPQHSGGRFVAPDDEKYGERLLLNTDKYLKVLKKTPFGRPMNTAISSGFGRRKDPLNGKAAIHEGLDFKGNTGDIIRSTADGIVKKSYYSKSWGHHIVIDHQNGYSTLYAHMNKRLVKRGDSVERGQIIGHVGSTGRSTGSHLHYEVHLDGKPINPMKFIKIANLSITVKN